MKMKLAFLCCFLIPFVAEAQKDTTISVTKEAWHRYFENSNDPGHSAIDDHKSYHNLVIATDRPDQTESPYLVPKGRFQIETGFWFEKAKDARYTYANTAYNTTLWKYGASDHFEFRLITEFLQEKQTERNTSVSEAYSGFNSVALGSKIFICEEHGLVPKTSLIAHIQLPYFGHRHFRPETLAPRFRFLMQHTLSDRFTFSYNLGGEWDGSGAQATIIYTASLGMNLMENTAMFIEAYGFITEGQDASGKFDGSFMPDHRIDGGITYVVTPDMQIDVSGGFGLSEISPDYFLSCGVSIRFPKAKRLNN